MKITRWIILLLVGCFLSCTVPWEKISQRCNPEKKAYKSIHVVYIDESGVFGRLNTHIPQDFHYHSFLLDSTNRVTLVGNPTANEDVRKLLYEKVFNLQSARWRSVEVFSEIFSCMDVFFKITLCFKTRARNLSGLFSSCEILL